MSVLKPAILIIDDKKYFRMVLGAILKAAGYRVALASNGEMGLRYLIKKKFNFDLVIVDLHVPIVTGFEIIEEIRKKRTKKVLPVVAITACYKKPEDFRKLNKLSVNRFLYKCMPFEDLLYIIRQVIFPKALEKRRQVRELCRLPVKYKYNNKLVKGHTFNLSLDGAFIKTKTPPKLGSKINLLLKLPHHDNEIKCNAKVIHIHKTKFLKDVIDHTGMGIYFMNVKQSDRRRLSTYLSSLS